MLEEAIRLLEEIELEWSEDLTNEESWDLVKAKVDEAIESIRIYMRDYA